MKKQLEVQLEQYALSVAQSRKVLDQVTQHKSLWGRMLRYQWDMINIPYWTERQQQTSNDLQHLQRADTNIEQAQRLGSCKRGIKTTTGTERTVTTHLGETQTEIQ